MENGVTSVGGPQLGEEKNVENQVSGDKVEERVLVGSDRLKDFEDEVFEEAVDSPEGIDSSEQLQDLGAKSEFGVCVKTVGDSSSLVVDENSNMENEAETFEEAVGALVEAGDLEDLAAVVGGERSKDLVGGDSVDKIDEGGTTSEVVCHELNGEKEVSEIGGDGGNEVSMGAVGVKCSHEVGLSREILSEDGKMEELKKDELGTVYHNTGGSVGVVQLQEDNGDALNDNVPKVDTECHKVEKSGELKGDDTVLASGNGVPESEQLIYNSTNLDMGLQGGSNGDVKDTSVPVDSGHHEEIHDLNANSAVPHTVEATAAPEILNLLSEKFVNESNEDIRDCVATSATLREEYNKTEPPCADEKVNGVGKESNVIEEPKNKVEKDHEEKKRTQGNGEREIPTPEKLASLSEKSTGPAPTPVRPAGLGRAAPLLEPAPRAVQQQQQQRVNGTASRVQSQQIEDPTNGRVMRVGKSATINSIFDEVKFGTDAFQLGTKKVQDVVGTVQGIKVRVIDTPGLLPSGSDQRQNEKILNSVKYFIKRTPPDIVLYLDRLDMQSRDFGDMPLLRTITDIFGPSIWFNAIVVLTHAASAPPDGQMAAGDMRLMNPVSLVENHSACRTNRAGQRVLPNGQVWKPHLLLLSFASKILAEANALLKLQDSPPGKPFATRSRAPPLPFLLSSLLQSRPQVKLPEEQFGDEDGIDDDLEESSDSEDESEYDDLPPFKSLTKAQVAKLTRAQKKAYFDELEYREKLLMRKQLKEEKNRRKMTKKMAAAAKDLPSDYSENAEEESGGAASVPVPMPDLALPASFDSDNPTHRYRYLDTSNQWLVRPVLETHGWDHDVGYEGINVERLFVVKDKIPLSFSGQVTKDKKDANVQMELASSIKHGDGKSTSLGFDMQTVGKDLAYTLRSEAKFCNYRKNKATAGLSVTLLGDALSAGLKVEDKLIVNKRFRMVWGCNDWPW
ncbi:hypothetical protein GH714_030263 [Hevea brasiliensis]|uniref:AIG1-type G domain-containing protein n=1 Tax=Hevea brasiliensis TaxID=3981 RepID=A0A6A6NBF8_HEVBR|nr:hypothetical protein GH714_030263 [Hevea brasiliensis]